jgi:hypothetical protein
MSDLSKHYTKTSDDGVRYYIGGPRNLRPFAVYANDVVYPDGYCTPNGIIYGEQRPAGIDGSYRLQRLRGGEAWIWTTDDHPTTTGTPSLG